MIILKFILTEYLLGKKKASEKRLKFSWEEEFTYRLDYHLSTSRWAKPSLLMSVTFLLICVGAIFLSIVDGLDVESSTWVAWTYVADPGTHADAKGAMNKFVSFFITVGGMLVFALMIQLISEFISEKVDELKKGRSHVMESHHTLILGWSDKSLAIIQQIALANESEKGGVIVVLAENAKNEMESKLQGAMCTGHNALDLLGTKVIFRSGNPLMESDLRIAAVRSARAIICLSSDNMDVDGADSMMVRQILSLKKFDLNCHIVAELQDIDNKRLVDLVDPVKTEVVVSHDIIGRLMIQCAREPGLAFILEFLMGFEGDEFYIEEWPELIGSTFYEITCRFNDAIPVGVKEPDGTIILNPENSFVIQEGVSILCLAEDNDTYSPNDGKYSIFKCGNIPPGGKTEPLREILLFCGWRRDLADMIMTLDEFVAEGSELWLFNTVPVKDREELLMDKGNKAELNLKHLAIKNVVGNPIIRRQLKRLVALDYKGKPTGETITLDEFDSILILADSGAIEEGADMLSSDSRALASTLIIQDLQKECYKEKQEQYHQQKQQNSKTEYDLHPPAPPISEILDARTRNLLGVAECKGFILSNQIISAALAQIGEDRDMNFVLGTLLEAEGSETYIRDITRYLDLSSENHVSFWDIALRARQLREVAIGYKPVEVQYREARDTLLNPPNKSQVREWREGDVIVVIAED
mmetsp:Transcript_38832/g.47315  ORF Transcript_38832/g.47315 Transcript_38832/m.47315 type:complete len:699 (-) Transcript_38832:227-2323(-)